MKNKTSILLSLVGCAICATFASNALANHRTGDNPMPEIMTAGDFNGDGNLDFVVNMSGYDMFAVLNGDGQGNFTLKRHMALDTLPKCVVSGDVNGDGKLDVVGISQWGYNIKVYLGDGKSGFHLAHVFPGDGEPNRLALADLNNDGYLDIVATAPDEATVLIYLGQSGGNFTPGALRLTGMLNCHAIEVADYNKDGKMDIAVGYFNDTSETGSHLQIFIGNGLGGFTRGQNQLITPQCNNINAVDLNKDGNVDLVVSGAGSENTAGNYISSYLGDGKGNFTVNQVIPLGEGHIAGLISIADFNEDGDLDVAYPLSSDGGTQHDFSTALLIYLGDGTGTGNLTQGQTVTVEEEPGSTWAADFNKDGHVDLACTNRTAGTLSIALGNGDGTFTTKPSIPMVVIPAP
jgi:hypothetical protein